MRFRQKLFIGDRKRMMCFLILQADRENYIASILPPLVDFQINPALLVSIFATQLPQFSTLFHPSKSCRGRIQTDKQGFKSPTRSEFGTKRSQVQILSPRPENGRKSQDFRFFLMQFAQRRIFGTFSLQLFCNLSECTKRPQGSICSGFAIFNHYIFVFSKNITHNTSHR